MEVVEVMVLMVVMGGVGGRNRENWLVLHKHKIRGEVTPRNEREQENDRNREVQSNSRGA